MKLIFDSHAHYDDDAFCEDRDTLLRNLPDKGICGVINCSADMKGSIDSINLANKYKYIFAAIGIHPNEINKLAKNYIQELEKLSAYKKVVAIGEIGLDYYYDSLDCDAQKNVFENQLKLASELKLPVIIHDREAHEDIMKILKKYKPEGVIHCFSGSVEMAEEIIKLGMHVGIGGVVTFKNAKNTVILAKKIPINKILVETDAPYMAPEPFRGKRCDSSHINYIAEKIAEIKGMQKRDILKYTKENAEKLFKIHLSED